MAELLDLSRTHAALPLSADPWLRELGFATWESALAQAADRAEAERARAWGASAPGQQLLAAVFGNSPFLSKLAIEEWPLLLRLVEKGPDAAFGKIVGRVETDPEQSEEPTALMRRLRVARKRVALVVGIADLADSWAIEQQMAALSRFAEAALGAAVRHLLRAASRRGTIGLADFDNPEHGSGLIVLGMGKLGGGELNYSSDIDLILLFDSAQNASPRPDGAQAFFPRLARDLVRILDERTGDGYVFRTDLRLRPDPRSTPLVLSTAAALAYYESVGQNWERAALIKARPVAGDRAAGERFLAELQPYIWRKNLDFAAIADIHSIKRQIQAHKGGGRIAVEGHDIKTGRGGIREIEFFAQTQQLIWGGRVPALRVSPTCAALHRLAETGRIDPGTAETLIADYRFLRRVEHRLQMVDDAQIHRMPSDRDGIARMGMFLGYRDADAFAADLRTHLASVERHYAELFEEAPSLSGPGNLVFTGAEDDPDTLATLARLGFADPHRVAETVRGWHHGHMRATRSQRAREILTELVPELLRIFGQTANPDTALTRFDDFLTRLPAGVQLFSLFLANPGLLSLVADIMAEAPRLAESLAQRPALLDAVLAAEFSAALPDRAGLAADLATLIAGARDYQDMLDILRRWADERRFQVGVQLLRRDIDGARAGMVLADIAEIALAALLPAVMADFARVHGEVPSGAFAVAAMGRLGSREMSLASDLDLIMIYDAPNDSPGSNGPRPLPVSTYYTRLSQRVISAITAPTGEGKLYEVDMRLRPSGESGPIASSLAAFAQYQRDAAWTWEHMALTRARPIAGDETLQRRIRDAIATALCRPRDPRQLVADVADMRRRIADNVRRPSPWDLRNRRGGLIDLEFTVQYLMLREAARMPKVLQRETGAALAALGEAGVLPPQGLHELSEALALLRHLRALLALLFDGVPDAQALAGPAAATLARCAGAVDFPHLDTDMVDTCARVRGWYERLVARPARRVAQSPQQTTGATAR